VAHRGFGRSTPCPRGHLGHATRCVRARASPVALCCSTSSHVKCPSPYVRRRPGDATHVCAPRPDPQPPQISEGDTNQISPDDGESLSAHKPSSDETQNNRQYSVRFQKCSTTALFAPSASTTGVRPRRPHFDSRVRADAMRPGYLRERLCPTSGVVVVGFLRRGRVSANSASAHPHQVWAIPQFAGRFGVTAPAAIPRSPAALRWCPLSRRHHELG
jgi:hypothetical protein